MRISFPESLLIVLLLFLFCNCTDPALLQKLDTAERIAREFPDSASAILKSIPDTSILSKHDRERYKLLIAETRHMLSTCDTMPEILLSTAEYFDREGDFKNAARAYYYAGNEAFNKMDYGNAIVIFLKAEKRNRNHGTPLFQALILRILGDSYSKLLDYSSAVQFHEKSLLKFQEAEATKYIGYAIHELAFDYYCLSEYDKAMNYAIKTLEYGEVHQNNELKEYGYVLKSRIALELEDYNMVISLYDEMRKAHLPETSEDMLKCVATAYITTGDIKKASDIVSLMKHLGYEDQSIEMNVNYYTGRYKEAFDYLKVLVDEQNEAMESLWRRHNAKIITDYYNAEEIQQEQKRKNQNLIWIISISAIVIISILLFIIFRRRLAEIRNKSQLQLMQIENLNSELNKLQEFLDSKETAAESSEDNSLDNADEIHGRKSDGESADKSMDKLVENSDKKPEIKSKDTVREQVAAQFKYIADLCAALDMTVNSTERTKTIDKINKLVSEFGSKESLNRLEDLINEKFDNLMQRFHQDLPNTTLKEDSYFIFRVLNFSTQTMSYIEGKHESTMYNRKSRFRKKIMTLPAEKRALYLSFLD